MVKSGAGSTTEDDGFVTEVTSVVNLPRKGHKPGGIREVAQVPSARDLLTLPTRLRLVPLRPRDRIVAAEWSRRLAPIMARVPEVRVVRLHPLLTRAGQLAAAGHHRVPDVARILHCRQPVQEG
jgi:hypothetical protein